jgi:YidC/Oxa1 family membrane protein insertase
MQTLISFVIESLAFLYDLTGNLGVAILVFTFLVRSILLPITIPTLKTSQKMKDLQPELKKLKDIHGKDKTALQKAQTDLYKKYNINPLAGCIPQLVQLGLLILLYQALISFLKLTEIHGVQIDPQFFWLDLTKPDQLYIFPILAAISQLFLSLLIMPPTETPDLVSNTSKKKKIVVENKKEENMADMAASIQQQMLFVMPIMTGFIALSFPSGLALYWVATTVFSIGQQVHVSGWGGIVLYYQRVVNKIKKK